MTYRHYIGPSSLLCNLLSKILNSYDKALGGSLILKICANYVILERKNCGVKVEFDL
jgi:hypothetical protein